MTPTGGVPGEAEGDLVWKGKLTHSWLKTVAAADLNFDGKADLAIGYADNHQPPNAGVRIRFSDGSHLEKNGQRGREDKGFPPPYVPDFTMYVDPDPQNTTGFVRAIYRIFTGEFGGSTSCPDLLVTGMGQDLVDRVWLLPDAACPPFPTALQTAATLLPPRSLTGVGDVDKDGQFELFSLNETGTLPTAELQLWDGQLSQGHFIYTPQWTGSVPRPRYRDLDRCLEDEGEDYDTYSYSDMQAPASFVVANIDSDSQGVPDVVDARGWYTHDGTFVDWVVMMTGQAGPPYNLSIPGVSALTCSDHPPIAHILSSGPVFAINVADYNLDGKQDMAVLFDNNDHNVHIYLGVFSPSTELNAADSLHVSGRPLSIATGDFNGDGKPDIAAITQSKRVDIAMNRSKGRPPYSLNFDDQRNGKLKSVYNAELGPDMTVADFGGSCGRDGTLDIVSIAPPSQTPGADGLTLLANGPGREEFCPTGAFAEPTPSTVYEGLPADLARADFDRDGFMDIAIAYSNGMIRIKYGDGYVGHFNGNTLRAKMIYYPKGWPYLSRILAGNFDGDSQPDLVFCRPYTGASPQCALAADIGGPVTPLGSFIDSNVLGPSIAAGDSDNDGMLELFGSGNRKIIVDNYVNGAFQRVVQPSQGDIDLSSLIPAGATFQARRLRVIDLDRDGKPDLLDAGAKANGQTFIIFLKGNSDANDNTFTVPADVRKVNSADLRDLAFGDFDLDRKPDLALLAESPARRVRIYTDAFGFLTSGLTTDALSILHSDFNDLELQYPDRLWAEQLDGDRLPDLLVLSNAESKILVWINNTQLNGISFAPHRLYATGNRPVELFADADLGSAYLNQNDLAPDLFVLAETSTAYLNGTDQATPTPVPTPGGGD